MDHCPDSYFEIILQNKFFYIDKVAHYEYNISVILQLNCKMEVRWSCFLNLGQKTINLLRMN
jgi:hypothetical protein